MLKVYAYSGCSTCRNALKWLRSRRIEFKEVPIRDTPPTRNELGAMLAAHGGEWKRLFNTSGQDYRALGIKDRLPTMTDEEAIDLLAENGNLIKRPFVIEADRGITLVGFKPDQWEARFGAPGKR